MDEAARGAKLRHRDVIGVALRLLEAKLHSPEQEEVIQAALKEAEGPHGATTSDSGVGESATNSPS